MSKQFYSYLSKRIIEYFQANKLTSGAKYNIQFEKIGQVEELYHELKRNTLCIEYVYKNEDEEITYKSYCLRFHDVDLIVAATIDNIQPDFLTRLRNLVGVNKGYEDTAILFIHNSTLDSIIGGTESFSKDGMPFNVNSVYNDINNKLNSSKFNQIDKRIIEIYLDNILGNYIYENMSIFDFSELLEVIDGTYIEKNQYSYFGLFYDSKLEHEHDNKKLTERINMNSELFNKVDEIHKYGETEQLDRYFDEKGILKLSSENWVKVDFVDVKKSAEEKKKITPLEYISCNQEWDRPDGSTKVKSRSRNIIVFNEKNKATVDLELTFDNYLKKEFIKSEGNMETKISGKCIKAIIYNNEIGSDFYKIVYKDRNIKYLFKIAMIRCDEKYLDNIKTRYIVDIKRKFKYICVETNDSFIVFNENAQTNRKYKITYNEDDINLYNDEKLIISISENFDYEDDIDLIRFNLNINQCIIPLGIRGTSEKNVPIEGLNVWKLKNENKCDFRMIGDNKLQHATREYFARDEFKRNLEIEKQIIEKKGVFFIETCDGLESIDLELEDSIREKYNNIINYYSMNRQLPSLTYLNEEIRNLYKEYIELYIMVLREVKEGSCLDKRYKNLFKIGIIRRETEDREILMTPLHPLNVAYQLTIHDKINIDKIQNEIIKKLNSSYLLPYILDDYDKLYMNIEQYHSPEWKYYVDETLPRYKSSRDFVSKLVNDKINEFVGHFKYLFDMGYAPIRINLINTGDCKEILEGVFKYYIRQLKNKKNNRDILPMELFIYSKDEMTNAFEEAAMNNNVIDLKSKYGLDLSVNNMSEDDVLNLYREKVHFYSKRLDEDVEYAHITFLEMSDNVKTITTNMDDIPSGIVLDGLISGVPSAFSGDDYRTGFGIEYANTNNYLVEIAMKLNALNTASGGEPYNSNHCKTISISNMNGNILNNIYEASHWVTFINPKVDLNYFKNDPETKNLLIIHYSDQYTTAGGYDAITVTRKSGPYQKVIEDFLVKKGIADAHKFLASIINMFNAINGDWLLRLLSSKSHFPKEKISILSAIKLAIAEFKRKNIIWVPISLEEILRVSRGAGLKQSDGFFSAKNLGFDNGTTSDDILLVGIETNNDKVIVQYYPLEVKIGENQPAYIEKGVKQAKKTKEIFNKTLLPNSKGFLSNAQIVYRNFIMQLVVTSAEKLCLYDVCKEENWRSIFDSDLRRKLLNEEYEIKDDVTKYMGEAGVISFKKGKSLNDRRIEDNVLIIEMSEDEGISFITKNVIEISKLINGNDIEDMFKYQNSNNNNEVLNEQVNYNINQSEECKTKVNQNENSKNLTGFSKENVVDEHGVIGGEKVIEEGIHSEKIENKSIEILLGTNERNNKQLYWCPNDTSKLMHTNTGIIGTMGTGKTQFTKSMITQLYRESKYNVDGKKVGILIFDYKGDYNKLKKDFIEATNAKVFDLYHLPINPLAVVKTEYSKPMLPLHIANGLKETLAKAFGLGIKQETLLRDIIMQAYEMKGIFKNKPQTWDNSAPTLKDVYDIYISKEDLKEDSLYAAFSNIIDFEIFEPNIEETKDLFNLIDGVTVIDLSGYDSGIQNLVVAIILDLFYLKMQSNGHSKIDGNLRQLNKVILVDEADNFLSQNFASLRKILKEGREFGIGTILSTQLLSHFSTPENEYANYILTWVIHNVANLSNKDVRYIFNTQSKQEDERLYNNIKNLVKHHSIVKMGDNNRPIYLEDKAFWQL